MKIKKLILTMILLTPIMVHAENGGDDTFGTWAEIGVQKNLRVPGLTVGMETEFRAQDEARWKIGADVGYKLNKYVKFGAYYNFLYRRYPEETKTHFDKNSGKEDGYNVNDAFWSPRHRMGIDVQGTKKFWKWFRVAVRERYQYTRRMESTYTQTKHRFEKIYDGDGNFKGLEWEDPETEIDTKSIKNDHILRSRIKLSVDKKGLDWEPFVYAEAHNNLASGLHMKLDKIRLSAGTSYKINKSHEVTLAYILTCNVNDEEDQNRQHALNIGYKFEF